MERWNHMGKLGAAVLEATAVMADLADDGSAVNGPEDLPDWDAVNWRHQEEQVRRLQQRIFKAEQEGNRKQVRNLQKLLLRSRANTLVSVRRVTQHNTGRRTPGVDRQVALTCEDRASLAMRLHRQGGPAGRSRCGGCTYRKKAERNARSEFPLSQTAPSNSGCAALWNPSGKPGWTRSSTASGRAADARTRS
jgi:N-terminal domain of reverse transcriptase